MLWLTLLIVVGLLFAYLLLIRPIIVHAPILSSAFKAEQSYFMMLRVKLVGWKTKITARAVMLSGLLVGAYDQLLPLVTGQDWTPITQKIPGWCVPLGLVLLGWLFSYLRKLTENPLQVITQQADDGGVHVVAVQSPAS